jgi:hypothetical protein
MMTLASAVLATVNPKRGLNLLNATFQNRDWVTQPAEELLNELDLITKLSQPTEMGTPWGNLVAMAWQARSRPIPWSKLATPSTGLVLALTCARALAWGLLHPAAVRLGMADFSRLSAQAAAAGVDLGGYIPDDFDSFAMKAEFVLSAYEEQIGGRLRQAGDDLSRALAARTP